MQYIYNGNADYPAYAQYTASRFGKTLRIRDGRNDTVATVHFPAAEKVTYGDLGRALAEHGYKPAHQWKPGTGVLRAALTAA